MSVWTYRGKHLVSTAWLCCLLFVVTCAGLLGLTSLFSTPAYAESIDPNAVNTHQLPDSSFIYDTSIKELATGEVFHNKQEVQVTGEAVGEAIIAESGQPYRWVALASTQANDDSTIAVYMSEVSANLIDTFGSYRAEGTVLQVRGVFYLNCPDHEGATDIHATNVSVVKKGSEINRSFNLLDFAPGAIAVLLGLGMAALFHFLRERRR